MLLEERDDAPAHITPRDDRDGAWLARWGGLPLTTAPWNRLRLRGSWTILGRFSQGTAGHVEEALVLLLHLCQHR